MSELIAVSAAKCYNVPTESTNCRRGGRRYRIEETFVNKFRLFAILPVAFLVLAACSGSPARAPSATDGVASRHSGGCMRRRGHHLPRLA